MGKTNKVTLIGNLGDEIKIHNFDNGGCVGNVSIATKETYKKEDGTKVENTEWHNLVFKNKIAEIIQKYTKKGSKLYVEGRLKYREYEKDGVKRYVTEIHVRDFEFLSSPSNNTSGGNDSKPNENANNDVANDGNEDLPF